MTQKKRKKRKLKIGNLVLLLGALVILILFGVLLVRTLNKPAPTKEEPTPTPTATAEPSATPEETVDPLSQVDIDTPGSITYIMNKTREAPSSFVPENLRIPNTPAVKEVYMVSEAADHLEEMFAAAANDGVDLTILSAYRSYEYQVTLYNNYVARDGEEAASRYSAKAGQSEHQTGLAADIGSTDGVCSLDTCYKDTAGGQWLAENAYKYGFVIRFPEGKEDITGYLFEPWHYRYIGIDLAKQEYDSGLCLEEFFSLVD